MLTRICASKIIEFSLIINAIHFFPVPDFVIRVLKSKRHIFVSFIHVINNRRYESITVDVVAVFFVHNAHSKR